MVRRCLATAVLVLLCGCTAAHYRRSADKEVYNIIQQAENRVFGHTNAFSIETPYSNRKPQEILPPELIEDRSQTNRRIISLREALELGAMNSREYQAQKEQLYLAALSLTGARYQFTPIFFANSQADLAGTGSESLAGGVTTRMGVSQLFKTGGRLSVSLANDLLRYFVGKPPGAARNSAIDTISVNLSQPLLQGFGANDPAVENLTQAERNVVYAVRTFSMDQREFDINIVNDYFRLVSMKSEVRNNYTNYLRRVYLLQYSEARSVDRVRASEVEDARTAALNNRIGYINSVASYLTQLDAFKLRLGIPVSEKLFLNDDDLVQLNDAGLIPLPMKPDEAFRIAVQKNLDMLNIIDRFEDIKRKVRIAADQLRPSLSLFGNASLSSDPPDNYADFDPNKIRYQVGISLDNLVDKLPARNNYRATLVSFESQLRTLVAGLDSLRDRIERGFRTLERERQNYISGQAALESALRRVDMDTTLLEAGRKEVRDLRESQDALIEAQNNLLAIIVSYQDARLQLLFNIGILNTAEERFWLKDPLTGQFAKAERPKSLKDIPEEPLILPNQILEPMP